MFSVRISPLVDACANMSQQAYRLNNQIYEIEQIIRQVEAQESISHLAQNIKVTKDKYVNDVNKYHQMSRVLDKSIIYYLNCENKICDNGEQCAIIFQRKTRVNNDLNKVISAIKNIEFV